MHIDVHHRPSWFPPSQLVDGSEVSLESSTSNMENRSLSIHTWPSISQICMSVLMAVKSVGGGGKCQLSFHTILKHCLGTATHSIHPTQYVPCTARLSIKNRTGEGGGVFASTQDFLPCPVHLHLASV